MPEHVVPQGSVFEPFGSFITTLQRNSCRPQRKAKIHLLLSPWQPGSTDALENFFYVLFFFLSFPKQKLSKHGKISSLRFCCPVQRKQFVMLLMHVTENTTEVGADHVAGLSLSGFAFVMNPGCWLQFTDSVGIFLLDRGLFSVDELILRLLYAVRS